ncbi:MAG TPA: hypothetical protein VMB78_00410 [Dissulfurispiraceae bacterium]|nr:hypothetical protein [Dissulfurispiraceae bacterium]
MFVSKFVITFGDDIYHTHPAGMWMLNFKFMHVNMNGLRAGLGQTCNCHC